jgi:L-fuculose-phosphate aldolase
VPDTKELVEICRKVYEKGFVAAFDGNISALTKNKSVLITRSGICKGEVEESDILEINTSGDLLAGRGKISTENKLHLFVYNKRPDIKAVIHCHPPFATAFAAAGKDLSQPVFPEVILTLGKVPLCEYATPSTDSLLKSIEPHINDSMALLLGNHGAVTFGSNLRDAYFRMEKLEHTAKTLLFAHLLGGAKSIPDEKITELLDIAEKTYGIIPLNKIQNEN